MTDHQVKMIVNDNTTLKTCLHQLTAGDLINCRIQLKVCEEHILLDLVSRGVHLFPSATSQLASKSKTYQTRIFREFMLPNSVTVYDIHDLINVISQYNSERVESVILKQDRKNAGFGIHFYRSIEDIFNMASNDQLSFPFVLQPYIEQYKDIRALFLGDYVESYVRFNPNNFRHNLHGGGKAEPYELTREENNTCLKVMKRGDFPYGHVDLMVLPSGKHYLTEINLRGGIRGAKITPTEYKKRLGKIHSANAQSFSERK